MKKYLYISTLFISISLFIVLILYFSLWHEKKNIYIAVASTFSGKYKEYGTEMQRGIQLYVDQTNAKGGVNGSPIKLLLFDDQGTKTGAIKVAKSIVRDKKILFVLGHYLSSTTTNAAPIYEKGMMPSITSSATLDDLTTNNDWLFRIIPPNSYQTEFIISYAKSALNVKTACVIYDTDFYGKNLLNTFTEKASALCIEILQTFSINSKDPKSTDEQIIQTIKSICQLQGIDMIFLATHAETSANIIVQLRKNKCNHVLMGGDSMASKFFIDALKKYTKAYSFSNLLLNDIYSITWFHPGLSGKSNIDFERSYMNKYHVKPSLVSTTAYDSAHVGITALKSIDSGKFSRTVRKNMKYALEQYYDNFHCIKGLTGRIFFDASGDMKKSMIVIKLLNGSFEPAFSQYISTSYKGTTENFMQKGIDGTIIASGDDYFSKTNLVLVAVDNIHINQIHHKDQTFHARFDISFRFKENFQPENIQFTNAKHPILLKMPKNQIQNQDNSQTYSYTINGLFTHDFNLKKFPFDTQTLSIGLRDIKQGTDKLLFSNDKQSQNHFKLDSKRYVPLNMCSYIENKESLSKTGAHTIFSQFHLDFHVKTKLTDNTMKFLLPFCFCLFLVYAGYFFPVNQMHLSINVNVFLLIVNAFCLLCLNHQYYNIRFSEYLYIVMYGLIGFTVCYQAILIRIHSMQWPRTVLIVRTTGIVFFPVIIISVLYFCYYFMCR
jgi:ABC-type branched-subunit amino acid transport system substrate-binding protein